MAVKRVRNIYTAKGDYTADGLRGRLLADELLAAFRETMKADGFNQQFADRLLDDAKHDPMATHEQVMAAKATKDAD